MTDPRRDYIPFDPPLAIVAGKRTPFVKIQGALANLTAVELGVLASKAALNAAGLTPDQIHETVLGSVSGQSDAANIARVIALKTGIPNDRVAHTVNRNCASGMESIIGAEQILRDRRADVILAGGVESMSQIPLIYNETAKSWFMRLQKAKSIKDKLSLFMELRPGHFEPISQLQLGLTDPAPAIRPNRLTSHPCSLGNA